ncbi:MAG TPA: hypothetical protein QGG18_06635 [Rhodospirillales bacterium]|nr:hypothetical protein [Rhodospirillales bacterium]|tara:strand:+ start:354 stop:707 length:354 start_codon:yes stop_codon:yes gene_type:complete
MPSKDKVKAQEERKKSDLRPFTVFYVDPQTPEEVHTDTIMASGCEDASAIASERHRSNTILHIRGIGDNDFTTGTEKQSEKGVVARGRFPCARFINGKFHSTTFNDDPLLESLFENA